MCHQSYKNYSNIYYVVKEIPINIQLLKFVKLYFSKFGYNLTFSYENEIVNIQNATRSTSFFQ